MDLENTFYDELIKTQQFVSIYLKNSIRLKGRIVSHDNTSLIMADPIPQMIYKDSVSSICPETILNTY